MCFDWATQRGSIPPSVSSSGVSQGHYIPPSVSSSGVSQGAPRYSAPLWPPCVKHHDARHHHRRTRMLPPNYPVVQDRCHERPRPGHRTECHRGTGAAPPTAVQRPDWPPCSGTQQPTLRWCDLHGGTSRRLGRAATPCHLNRAGTLIGQRQAGERPPHLLLPCLASALLTRSVIYPAILVDIPNTTLPVASGTHR